MAHLATPPSPRCISRQNNLAIARAALHIAALLASRWRRGRPRQFGVRAAPGGRTRQTHEGRVLAASLGPLLRDHGALDVVELSAAPRQVLGSVAAGLVVSEV